MPNYQSLIVLIIIFVVSGLLTYLLVSLRYIICRHCQTMNAKRREHCRNCQKYLR